MISGTLSFFHVGNAFSDTEHIRRVTDCKKLVFHPVKAEGFTGGFYLQPHLPYTDIDFFYHDEKNDILVLFSGSVYNKQELFNQLQIRPVGDPELIARLFIMEGADFVKRLNGDFALLITRPNRKQAFLFRDHLGIRPIAWTYDNNILSFSSDIIGLCRAFSKGQVIDSDYLLGSFKYINYLKTPNIRVTRLLPGHYLEFSQGGVEIKKYWFPEKVSIDQTLTYSQILSDLKEIVFDAVKIRCDRRFTAGAHISSGIDSGMVSALARKEYSSQEPFYGFSWSPADFNPGGIEPDERRIIKSACEKTHIKPVFSDMDMTYFPEIVSSFYYNHGSFAEDKTVEQAAALSTNLIFSGWGGDEFISTGDSGIEQDLLRGMKLRTFFKRNPVSNLKKFIRNQFIYVLNPAFGILGRNMAKSFRNDARYIRKPFKRSDRRALRNFYFHTSRHQHHLRLLEFYHLQDRCESWAINGYRKGVEYRYPLLDKRIIEYMLKVPSIQLCRTDHYRPLLREIGEGILPDEIRWNWSKNDPVYWAYVKELHKELSKSLMDEADSWSDNSDLFFIDFDLLRDDIRKYRNYSGKVDADVLFTALVSIKAIHEFTVEYRKEQNGRDDE